jgi:hypothetical protein
MLQRKCAACEEAERTWTLRAKGDHTGEFAAMEVPPIVHEVLGSSGEPLDAPTRAFFEPRFGRDFSQVRVHADDRAAESARSVGALAYAVGPHIAFARDRYAPTSQTGRALLAHELAHVAQAGASLRRFSLGELVDDVEDTAKAAVNSVESTASSAVQTVRDAASSIAQTTDNAAGAIADGAKEVASHIGQGVKDAGAAAVQGAKDLGAAAKQKISDVGTAVANVPGAVADSLSDAADWAKEKARQALIGAADKFASLYGGSVKASGSGIEITVPSIELFEPFTESISAPTPGRFVPIIGDGFPVGPFFVEAAVGLRVDKKTALAGIGPGVLRNVVVRIDPTAGSYAATGEVYVGAAVSETNENAVEIEVGAAGLLGEIPIEGTVEGGARLINRDVAKGGAQDNITVGYSGGILNVDYNRSLRLGYARDIDTELYLEAQIEGKTVCNLIWPLTTHRLSDGAVQLDLPISISYGSGKGTATLGPPTVSSIPVDNIETIFKNDRPPNKCMKIDEVAAYLCKIGKLPASVCSVLSSPSGVLPVVPSIGPPGVGPPGGGGVSPTSGHLAPIGTKGDPIEMIWLKPLRFYDNPIRLDGGTYSRDKKKKLLSGRIIGASVWPEKNDLVQKNKTPRGLEAVRFTKALDDEGYENWDDNSPDHVVDLFFAGDDHFENLWPLDRSVNARAGTWHAGQGVTFNKPSDPPTQPPRREAIGSTTLDNCWFVIKSVAEPPP